MDFIDLKSQYQRYKNDINVSIQKVLDDGQYIYGEAVKRLEADLAKYVGVPYGIGVASGTSALTLSLRCLDLKPGDEIITSAFSFIATAEAIVQCGAKPVFVDIDPKTFNIETNQIESAITKKTRAILAVSLFGLCPDFDAIQQIASVNNLKVIEDGCQSFGAEYNGRHSCGLSLLGCTSFYPSKPLGGYGDGGMVFTPDKRLAKKLQMLRMHGLNEDGICMTWGDNSRLDTIQAAVILAKLPYLNGELKQRRMLAMRYASALKTVCQVPHIPADNTHVFGQYAIRVGNRDSVIQALQDNQISWAVHYHTPLHLHPAARPLGYALGDFPEAEKASNEVLCLPIHPFLKNSNQDKVISVIQKYARK